MSLQIDISGGEKFRDLGRRFRKAADGKTMRSALTKGLKSVVDEPVQALKSGYRTMHIVTEGKSHGQSPPKHAHALRESVAKLVKVRVRYTGKLAGVSVYVDAARMPAGLTKIPRYLERPRGWRHPTWGHRDRWVTQHGTPTFRPTLRRYTPKVRAGVVRAVNDALKELQ